MPRAMAESDILIITMVKSKFLSKTIPGKFQSYLTAYKPIVGMIDGVTNKIIKHNRIGLVTSSGNFKDFAKNILKIYKSKPIIRAKYKKIVFQYYSSNFDKNKILNNLECIMKEVIK
jgi:glycosyltransferase involved in cell wall biosynthesis